jgi:hypothetical protein
MVLINISKKRVLASLGLLLLLLAAPIDTARAVCIQDQQTCSTGYGVSESFFGSGGELNACSTAYCSKQSAGELAQGNSSTGYNTAVLADSPVAFWRLNESSGTTAADSSGNGRNGTYTGSYTQGQASLVGNGDSSTSFGGAAGDYVNVTGNAAFNINTTNKLAVEFWYAGTDTGTGGGQPSGLVTANVNASTKQWAIGLEANGHINAQNIRVLGVYDDNIGNVAINDGNPHHVVVNYDVAALTVDIYVDGVLDVSNSVPSYDFFGTPVVRIANNPRSDSIAGKFDEVAIYNNTLSPTRIAAHYAAGNGAATGNQINAGFNTNREESLEMLVNTPSINFGTLSTASTATSTATFQVKAYLASGYQVVTSSPAPKNSTYTMASPSSPTANATGTEQFGINLVANNSCGGGLPGSLGASPVQVPDSTFSFGAAASGYNTACQFKYVNGDTIASSSKSSGETDYTISYIMNINSVTPGGTYNMAHNLVATATY